MSSTPPPQPTPSFHAELLSNIRSITLSISLPTLCKSTTTLTFTSPTLLELVHDGIATSLPLPAAAAQIALKTTPGARSLSYRLPVPARAPQPQQQLQEQEENYVPWSASDLENAAAGKSVSLMCKACSCVVLDGKAIGKWKDLPSGNWAEMMEFWHCHKPGPDRKTNGVSDASNSTNGANCASSTSNGTKAASSTSRGTHAATVNGNGSKYRGLQGGFKAELGTVLVDLTYFLVAPTDCEGIQVVEAPCANTLICSNCKCHLGSTDPTTNSYTLNKWKLTLSLSAHGIRSEFSYPLEPFIVAQLLALAEGENTRRMLISASTPAPASPTTTDPTASEKKLKLWVFSSDVRYTSSRVTRPLRAVKVFYQDGKEGEEEGQQRQKQGTPLVNNGFEEVALQREMVVGLKQKLEEGVDAVDGFRGWNVGYLMRFERESRTAL